MDNYIIRNSEIIIRALSGVPRFELKKLIDERDTWIMRYLLGMAIIHCENIEYIVDFARLFRFIPLSTNSRDGPDNVPINKIRYGKHWGFSGNMMFEIFNEHKKYFQIQFDWSGVHTPRHRDGHVDYPKDVKITIFEKLLRQGFHVTKYSTNVAKYKF